MPSCTKAQKRAKVLKCLADMDNMNNEVKILETTIKNLRHIANKIFKSRYDFDEGFEELNQHERAYLEIKICEDIHALKKARQVLEAILAAEKA